jgi:uncharacterized DUF497 family protein
MSRESFEWDPGKDRLNCDKHSVAFVEAQYAFADPYRVIARDRSHSHGEQRYYRMGKVAGGILTVRFTWRGGTIRIIGAGYWRKGKHIYERENQIPR